MFFDDKRFLCKGMIIILAIGIIARVVVGLLMEYNNDVSAWAQIMANIEGGNALYNVAGYYYPPVWGYLLGLFTEITGHIGLDEWGNMVTEFVFMIPRNDADYTTPTFNLVLTMFLMISDLLVALIIYWLILRFTDDKVKAKIGFAFYFVGLHVIFICAAGGMFDSYSALFAILAVALLMTRKDVLAGMMFAMGVLLKLFPAMFIFILVAYLFKKDRECWKIRFVKAVAGAVIMIVVVMLPQILDGTFMDSLSFITARAGDVDGVAALLLKYSSMLIYPIILILEAFIAYHFVKTDTEDVDRTFLWYVFLSSVVIFIYPSTPQYILLMTPFLIIVALMYDRRFVKPLLLLTVASTIFLTSSIVVQLGGITAFWGAIPFDIWHSMYDIFYAEGLNAFMVWSAIGGVLQYISIIWVIYVALEAMGINVKRKLHIGASKTCE